jgi:hypothetical protein
MDEIHKLTNIADDLIPPSWDRSSLEWAIFLRDFVATIPGTKITGAGLGLDGTADFSFYVDGKKHFWVEVKLTHENEPSLGEGKK